MGEGQSLLLGRQFLKLFTRVTFDWSNRSITLGRARIDIEDEVVGGNPIDRARSVKLISDQEEELVGAQDTDLTRDQRVEFATLLKEFDAVFNDKPGRTAECEHRIDTGAQLQSGAGQHGYRHVGRKKLIGSLMKCWSRGCVRLPSLRGPVTWF